MPRLARIDNNNTHDVPPNNNKYTINMTENIAITCRRLSGMFDSRLQA